MLPCPRPGPPAGARRGRCRGRLATPRRRLIPARWRAPAAAGSGPSLPRRRRTVPRGIRARLRQGAAGHRGRPHRGSRRRTAGRPPPEASGPRHRRSPAPSERRRRPENERNVDAAGQRDVGAGTGIARGVTVERRSSCRRRAGTTGPAGGACPSLGRSRRGRPRPRPIVIGARTANVCPDERHLDGRRPGLVADEQVGDGEATTRSHAPPIGTPRCVQSGRPASWMLVSNPGSRTSSISRPGRNGRGRPAGGAWGIRPVRSHIGASVRPMMRQPPGIANGYTAVWAPAMPTLPAGMRCSRRRQAGRRDLRGQRPKVGEPRCEPKKEHAGTPPRAWSSTTSLVLMSLRAATSARSGPCVAAVAGPGSRSHRVPRVCWLARGSPTSPAILARASSGSTASAVKRHEDARIARDGPPEPGVRVRSPQRPRPWRSRGPARSDSRSIASPNVTSSGGIAKRLDPGQHRPLMTRALRSSRRCPRAPPGSPSRIRRQPGCRRGCRSCRREHRPPRRRDSGRGRRGRSIPPGPPRVPATREGRRAAVASEAFRRPRRHGRRRPPPPRRGPLRLAAPSSADPARPTRISSSRYPGDGSGDRGGDGRVAGGEVVEGTVRLDMPQRSSRRHGRGPRPRRPDRRATLRARRAPCRDRVVRTRRGPDTRDGRRRRRRAPTPSGSSDQSSMDLRHGRHRRRSRS